MINAETTVPTPRALAGAGQPPQTAALHTLNPDCPRAPSPAVGGAPAHRTAAPRPPGGSVHPGDPRTRALAACPSEPVSRRPCPSSSPHPAGPLHFRPPGSRYPPWPPAWKPCAPPPPPPLPRPELGGRAPGRAGAASAPLPRPGWPREEVPLSVSGEGRPGRPEGAVPRTGSAGRGEALTEGRARGWLRAL